MTDNFSIVGEKSVSKSRDITEQILEKLVEPKLKDIVKAVADQKIKGTSSSKKSNPVKINVTGRVSTEEPRGELSGELKCEGEVGKL